MPIPFASLDYPKDVLCTGHHLFHNRGNIDTTLKIITSSDEFSGLVLRGSHYLFVFMDLEIVIFRSQ
jgi:hypothetical protein